MSEDFDKTSFERINEISTENRSNIWVITFVDTLSILISFFILVYATSSPYNQRLKTASLNNNSYVEKKKIPQDISLLYEVIISKLTQANMIKYVCVTNNFNYLAISINEKELFIGHTSSLKASSEVLLTIITDILTNADNSITITATNLQQNELNNQNRKEEFKLPLNRAIIIAQKLSKLGYDREVNVKGLSGKFYKIEDSFCKMNLDNNISFIINDYR